MLMMGREIHLPIDVLYGPHSQEDPNRPSNPREFSDRLRGKLHKVHAMAREHLNLATEKQKRAYNHRIFSSIYQRGKPVWLFNSRRQKGRSPKLQNKWDGPYLVVEKLSDLVYAIQRNPRNRLLVVHHNRLKPFYGEVDSWLSPGGTVLDVPGEEVVVAIGSDSPEVNESDSVMEGGSEMVEAPQETPHPSSSLGGPSKSSGRHRSTPKRYGEWVQ